MASPDSNKPAPTSPLVQDSPIFGYVSSLSPIKPVNARSTVQVYENIDVPSPQMVFKTPNFIRPRYSNLSERSQHLASPGMESLSPGYVNNTGEFSGNMIMGASLSLPAAQSISYSDKECTNVGPSPNQSCTSPTNCVDVFLADPLENSENSSSSPEFCVKRVPKDKEGEKSGHSENQMEDLKEDPQVHPHPSAIPTKEQINERLHSKRDAFLPHISQTDSVSGQASIVELHAANMKEHARRSAVMCLRAPYQTEVDPGSVSLAAETIEINEGSITEHLGQVSKNENDSVYKCVLDHSILSSVKDFDISHTEKENYTNRKQDLKQQTAKTGQSDELDCTPKLHPGSPQSIQTGDNFVDNSAQMPSASTENHISFDPEDDANYKRGKRKRLQFEAAENLRISNRKPFNCATEAPNLDLSTLLDVETASASHSESITNSGHKQVDRSVPASAFSGFLVNSDQSGKCKEDLVAAHRPAGIGLHLNSIGSAASIISNSNVQLERNSSVQEDKALAEDIDQLPEKSKNCTASLSIMAPAKLTFSSDKPLNYVANENNVQKQLGNQAFQQHSSGSYQSPLSAKHLKSLVPLKHMDRYMSPCTMILLSSEEANKSEESTQTSPKKKKKKTPENDGQKRCNCKRSKCLKLYCDCFAAGSFCSDACACLECCNKVEHEETVRETRQQIESRNPLAFAPKVILRVSDPPKASGDNKTITPASGRHKRGCNCKKSLCLKKYCECFQAGVGCSLGCRCEGCKNTFGTKDGCEISEMVVEHRRPKEGGWERDLSSELECIEVNRQITITEQCRYRLSPVTPLLQSSMGNDVTKPQFPASYFPSPESVASAVRSYDPSGVDLNAKQNSELAEDRSGSSPLLLYDPKSEFQNAGEGDPFSPGWEGFPDICSLSPLLKASPNAVGSSSALQSGERKIVKLHKGSNRIALGALRWRSSPITPLPQSGEGKLQREPDSDNTLQCNPEDDTPEILKETRSPVKSVTATSPNQKRVSPPHQTRTNANSPSSLRSGRKYILQSMPIFPPLTPYSKTGRDNET